MNTAQRSMVYSAWDECSFKCLFHTHYATLVAFARTFLHDDDTAQDLVQELFVDLWSERHRVVIERAIKSYLFTAVRNRCLNRLSQQRINAPSAALEGLACTDDDPAEHEALLTEMERVIDQLPPARREVFRLNRLQRMSYREVADRLSLSVRTVEHQISKAMRTLRSEVHYPN
jgi:RNA polymerase sigma-70 factor (ECF subfamily)